MEHIYQMGGKHKKDLESELRVKAAQKACQILTKLLDSNGGDINSLFKYLHENSQGKERVLTTGDWENLEKCSVKIPNSRNHNIGLELPSVERFDVDPVYVPINVVDSSASRTNIATFDSWSVKRVKQINVACYTPVTAQSYVNYSVLASTRLSLMFSIVDLILKRITGPINIIDIGSGNPIVGYRRIDKSRIDHSLLNHYVSVDPNYDVPGSLVETPRLKNVKFAHYKCGYLDVPRLMITFKLAVSYMALHHVLGPRYDERRIDRFALQLDAQLDTNGYLLAVVMRPSVYSPLNKHSGWIIASDNGDGTYCVLDKLSNNPFNDPLPDYVKFARRLVNFGFATQFVMGNNVRLMNGENVNLPFTSNDTMVVVVTRLAKFEMAKVTLPLIPNFKSLRGVKIDGYKSWQQVSSQKSLWKLPVTRANTCHYMNGGDLAGYAYAPQNYYFGAKLNGTAALLFVKDNRWRIETRDGHYVDGVVEYSYEVLAQVEIVHGNVNILHVLSFATSINSNVSTGFCMATSYELCNQIFGSWYSVAQYYSAFVYSAEGTIIQNALSTPILFYAHDDMKCEIGSGAYVKRDSNGVDFCVPVRFDTGCLDEFEKPLYDIMYYEMLYTKYENSFMIIPKEYRPDKNNHTVPFKPIVEQNVLEESLKLMLSIKLDKHDHLEVGVAYLQSLIYYIYFSKRIAVTSYKEFNEKYKACINLGHFPGYFATKCNICDQLVHNRLAAGTLTRIDIFDDIAYTKRRYSPAATTRLLLSPEIEVVSNKLIIVKLENDNDKFPP
jgi:hypothetical protein